MKKISSLIIALALVLAIGFGATFFFHTPKTAFAIGTILKANVSTGVSVGTSSVEVLPASSGRTYAVFVNDSANVIYISLDGNAAVAGKGIRLNASGGSYEINSLNQFVASVHAIAAGAGSNLTVTAAQ